MLCDLAPIFAELIAKRVVEAREQEQDWIDSVTSEFNEEQKAIFAMRCKGKLKTMKQGYLFWWLGGSHYLYTGRPLKQLIFWGTLGGCGMWWMMDFFLMFFVVDRYNRKLKTEIIEQMFDEQAGVETPPMPEELAMQEQMSASMVLPKPGASDVSDPKMLSQETKKPNQPSTSGGMPYGGQMGFTVDGGK